ncbi:MAG TPA: sialidase family protein, partial [bacterium]|nr:sialidase family protein [bacterium]
MIHNSPNVCRILAILLWTAAVSLPAAGEILDPLENVIHFSPASTKIYLGSPSLIRLENGDLLAAMDMFGPNAPKPPVSMIFRSTDNGKKWRFVTEIEGSFWANLFTHRGALYFLGCSEANGSIVIRRSLDGGVTWTTPRDEQSGLLFPKGPEAGYHCAPMPVVEHQGRLYRAFENNATHSWPDGFRAFVISADADADLLLASSWTMSNQLEYDQESDPPGFAQGAGPLSG